MKKTKKVLASLAIAGMLATMVPFNVFASDSVPAMGTRLAGVTAYDTAQQIAQQYASADSVVLAAGMTRNSVDALAAGPLAAQLKAPILLTDGSGTLAPQAKAELQRLMPKKVYVTSGTAVIKPEVLAQVEAITGAGSVVALGGYDAFETSLNIAKKMVELGAKPTGVVVAGGWATPADALSAASIASAKGMPILAVAKAGLNADQLAFVKSLTGLVNSYIVGGTAVVDAAVDATLPGTVARLAGTTQYDTNLKVLEKFTDVKYDKVFVANGKTFVDALAGAPLAAQYKAPIVLADQVVNSGLAAYVQGKMSDASAVVALGGTAAVPQSVVDAVKTPVVAPSTLTVTSVSAKNSMNQTVAIDGATNVDNNAQLVVKFSGSIDDDTANLNTLKLVASNGSQMAGTYTYSNLKKEVTFVPSAALADNTKYTFTVTADVKSPEGATNTEKVISFTTGSKAVVRSFATTLGVPNTLTSGDFIDLTFSKDMDPATITTSTVKVYDETNSEYVPINFTNYASKVARFTVDAGVSITNAKIRIETKGISTLAGGAAADYVRTFIVAASITPVQQTALIAGNVYPKIASASLNSQYFQGFNLMYAFGRTMDGSTINGDTIQIREAGSTVAIPATVTFESGSSTAKIVPNADLKDEQDYEVYFDTASIKDAYGKTITNPNTVFTTGDYTRPVVVETSPANAVTGVHESEDNIRITFDDAVGAPVAPTAPAALNAFGAANNILLVDSNNVGIDISGALSRENQNKTIVINTSALGLAKNTTYTVKLNGGTDGTRIVDDAVVNALGLALESDYEFTFTTRAVDTVAPKIQTVKYDDVDLEGQYKVDNDEDIEIVFDEEVTAPAAGTVVVNFVDKTATGGTLSFTDTFANVLLQDGGKKVVIPAARLANLVAAAGKDSEYELTVQNFTDTSGNVMTSKKFTFTTGPAPSVVAGMIDWNDNGVIDGGETTSVAYAMSVPVDASFEVVLSDPDSGLQTTSVNTTNVYIQDASGSKVTSTIDNLGGGSYLVNPSSDLAASSAYDLVVDGVKDQVGNVASKKVFSFRTVTTVHPEVTITPVDGKTQVPVDSNVTVAFNMPMNVLSINNTTIQLWIDTNDNDVIDGAEVALDTTVTYDTATMTATINPKSYLRPIGVYKVKVNKDLLNGGAYEGVVSTGGTTLVDEETSNFQASSSAIQPKLLSAKHISVNAVAGTEDGLPLDKLILNFDVPVAPASLAAAGFTLTDLAFSADTGIVEGDIASCTLDGNQVVITFTGAAAGTIIDGFSKVNVIDNALTDVNSVKFSTTSVVIEK